MTDKPLIDKPLQINSYRQMAADTPLQTTCASTDSKRRRTGNLKHFPVHSESRREEAV